jgi:hypothetical protein
MPTTVPKTLPMAPNVKASATISKKHLPRPVAERLHGSEFADALEDPRG